MTPSSPLHRCDPEADLRVTSDDAPRLEDADELFRSPAEQLHDAVRAAWFVESLRLPLSSPGVPFLGTKWAAIRLGDGMSLGEWSRALRRGIVTEVPTLTAPLLVPALTNPDPEIRNWAYLALGEPAVPDARWARRLAHPEPERPLLPNTIDGDVQPLPPAHRRPWVRPGGGLRAAEDAWPSDE